MDEKEKAAPPEEWVRAAYDAWSAQLGGMVPEGLQVPYRLPTFDKLSDNVRKAWDAAIVALMPEEAAPVEPEPEKAPKSADAKPAA